MKTNILLVAVAALIFALAWSVRGPHSTQRPDIAPVFDRTGQPIVVTVYLYNTVGEVTAEYARRHGRRPGITVQGFAVWPQWQDTSGAQLSRADQYECEIHSVRPRIIDGEDTTTLGHELLHCLWGNYHQPYQ